jgi:hypothetical protein
MVGWTRATTSSRATTPRAGSRVHPATSSAGAGVRRLGVAQVGHVVGEQAIPINGPESPSGLVSGQTVRDQGVAELVGDACTRSTRAEHHDPLLVQRCAAGLHRGEHRGQVHRAGALHIVVEGEYLVVVPLEDAPGVAGPDVLPVQQRSGEE